MCKPCPLTNIHQNEQNYIKIINIDLFLFSCNSKLKDVIEQEQSIYQQEDSYSNNKISIKGNYLNLSSSNSQKIIFNGSDNELIIEYFDTFFNSSSSNDVLIIEGNGNKIKISHNGVVSNSSNSCDTLVIKGENKSFELLHKNYLNNSKFSNLFNVIHLNEDGLKIENSDSVYDRKIDSILNEITNEWKPADEVFNSYFKKASLRDAEASFLLGSMYQTGVGTVIDIKKAIYYYEIAANQNHIKAQTSLGYLYEKSIGGIERDFEKALFWYFKAWEENRDMFAYKKIDEINTKIELKKDLTTFNPDLTYDKQLENLNYLLNVDLINLKEFESISDEFQKKHLLKQN